MESSYYKDAELNQVSSLSNFKEVSWNETLDPGMNEVNYNNQITSSIENPSDKYDVLLIYDSDADFYYAQDLLDLLQTKSLRIFDFAKDCPPGTSQRETFANVLKQSVYTCIVVTRHFINNFWLNFKTEMAIQDMIQNSNKKNSVIVVAMDPSLKLEHLPLDLQVLSPLLRSERYFMHRFQKSFANLNTITQVEKSTVRKSPISASSLQYNRHPSMQGHFNFNTPISSHNNLIANQNNDMSLRYNQGYSISLNRKPQEHDSSLIGSQQASSNVDEERIIHQRQQNSLLDYNTKPYKHSNSDENKEVIDYPMYTDENHPYSRKSSRDHQVDQSLLRTEQNYFLPQSSSYFEQSKRLETNCSLSNPSLTNRLEMSYLPNPDSYSRLSIDHHHNQHSPNTYQFRQRSISNLPNASYLAIHPTKNSIEGIQLEMSPKLRRKTSNSAASYNRPTSAPFQFAHSTNSQPQTQKNLALPKNTPSYYNPKFSSSSMEDVDLEISTDSSSSNRSIIKSIKNSFSKFKKKF